MAYNANAMNKGLFVYNAYLQSNGVKYVARRLNEELTKLGATLSLTPNKGASLYIGKDGRLCNGYAEYDFGIYWDKDLALSLLLEKSGLRLFNSANAIRLCDDKSLTAVTLANEGIAMPFTIPAPLNYVGGFDESFLKDVARILGLPLIAKEVFGSLGKEVFLIQDFLELCRFEKDHATTNHLYQQFISSSFGQDYRLIVIGGKFFAGMLRKNASGDFRSNIAQGAIGIKTEIPASYQAVAEKAATLLGLDYCGVDILIGENGEPLLCEVNSNAYMEGIEKTTGANIAKAYAEHIIASLEA